MSLRLYKFDENLPVGPKVIRDSRTDGLSDVINLSNEMSIASLYPQSFCYFTTEVTLLTS